MEKGMSRTPPDDGPSTYRYDPELPFLYELEREVRRMAWQAARNGRSCVRGGAPGKPLQADRGLVGAATGPDSSEHGGQTRKRRGGLPRTGSRVARRAFVLVALLCLIGASAYGAGHIFATAPNPTIVRRSAFVPVAGGRERTNSDDWSLRLYMRGGELCRVLVVGENESSRCSMPFGADTFGVTSMVSPTRRYFYGIAGPAVERVEIHAGGLAANVSTQPAPTALARAAGLPRGARWFVAILGRPVGEPDPPAHVLGIGARGRAATHTLIDCAETTEPQPCPR